VVALKARSMGGAASRSGKARPPSRRPVTVSAICRIQMRRVIEFSIKAGKRGEGFQLTSLLRIGVTNRTDRVVLLLEMFLVTACTRDVPGELHIRGVIFAGMAEQTRQPDVLLTLVIKF